MIAKHGSCHEGQEENLRGSELPRVKGARQICPLSGTGIPIFEPVASGWGFSPLCFRPRRHFRSLQKKDDPESLEHFPPMHSARRLLITRPRPAPPYRRVVEVSTCWNALIQPSFRDTGWTPMILFARFQRPARRRAQGIIGVPPVFLIPAKGDDKA